MSTEREHLDDLEAMLEASRGLRARFRAESVEEPPPALDDAIRAQARRAVGARPRPAGGSFLKSWRVPLSIAAVLVMSVSMVLTVTREGRHLPQAEMPSGAHTGAPAQPAAAPSPPMEESKPAASKPAQGARARQSVEMVKPLPGEEHHRQAEPFPQTPAPASIPAPSEHANPAHAANEAPRSLEEPARKAAAGAAAPAPAPMPSQADASAGAPAAPPPPAASAAPAPAVAERRGMRGQPGQLAAAPPAQDPAEGGLAKRNEQSDQRAADSAGAKKLEVPGAGLQGRSAARMQVHADAAAWESDPKAWLSHIEQLARSQRGDEARESLKQFRKRYPTYPLPAEFPVREP